MGVAQKYGSPVGLLGSLFWCLGLSICGCLAGCRLSTGIHGLLNLDSVQELWAIVPGEEEETLPLGFLFL